MDYSDMVRFGYAEPDEPSEYVGCDCGWEGTWSEAIEDIHEDTDGTPWVDAMLCPNCKQVLED